MQLTDKKLSVGLALATSTLLGTAPQVNAEQGWQADTAVLFYSEADDRVQAVEPALNLSKTFADESSASVRIVYDALTGASPNGAAVAGVPQTFTSASGLARLEQAEEDDDEDEIEEYGDRASYTIAPGDVPLDESFEDTRTTLSGSWSKPFGNGYTSTLGGAWSTEGDFTSYSVNGALAKDFNGNNTTLSAGVNLEFDTVTPNGGMPVPLTSYASHNTSGTSDTKQVTDVIAGVTQVISRRWIMQFNASLSQSSGHHDDPYKFLTVADNGNLITDPDNPDSYLYLFEHRPEDRQKISLYWQNKVAIGSSDAIDIGYRYMTDDWGVDSSTLDLTYHWQLTDGLYLEPHYRYYEQSAADFYTPFLQTGNDVQISGNDVTVLTDYASSDPRLGAFSANTLGLKLGLALSRHQEMNLRVEQYQQTDQNSRVTVPAGSHLDGQDQFAELSATWVQLGYSVKW